MGVLLTPRALWGDVGAVRLPKLDGAHVACGVVGPVPGMELREASGPRLDIPPWGVCLARDRQRDRKGESTRVYVLHVCAYLCMCMCSRACQVDSSRQGLEVQDGAPP